MLIYTRNYQGGPGGNLLHEHDCLLPRWRGRKRNFLHFKVINPANLFPPYVVQGPWRLTSPLRNGFYPHLLRLGKLETGWKHSFIQVIIGKPVCSLFVSLAIVW
jgi:hypothetical protein